MHKDRNRYYQCCQWLTSIPILPTDQHHVGSQGRLRIPHFRRIKNPQFPILEKSSRIVSNAENGGMAVDTRFVFIRLEH